MALPKSGSGETDYEKYIRTPALLALQKDKRELANSDELLFQVIHQAMELWMKAAVYEVEKIVGWLDEDEHDRVRKHLFRIEQILDHLIDAFPVLETMTQADYHEIRMALGRGSGADSPGFNQLLEALPKLMAPFENAISRAGFDLLTLFRDPHKAEHRALYDVSMGMLAVDRCFQHFRYRHLQLARTQIGLAVKSLKGVPARAMEKHILAPYFPALWTTIEELTNETSPTY
jgi:tryptophan 2,3-dioxygenase